MHFALGLMFAVNADFKRSGKQVNDASTHRNVVNQVVFAAFRNTLDHPGDFRGQLVGVLRVQNLGDLCPGRYLLLVFPLLQVKLDVLIGRPHRQGAEVDILGERAVPRSIGLDIFGDARLLTFLSFGDFRADGRLRDLGCFLLNVSLRYTVEQIGVGLETKLAALKRHIIVEVVAKYIGFDDEVSSFAGMLPRFGFKKLLRKFRNIGLQGVVSHLPPMSNEADLDACRARRVELENPDLKGFSFLVRGQ